MDKTPQPSTDLIVRLFCRHYRDPVDAVRRFEKNLSSLNLPFNFYAQLRELVHPTSPEVPTDFPSFIYYYVPGSNWGTDRPLPPDPTHSSFVYHADGIGLNMGCPVRLARALDILAQLPDSEQVEVRAGIASATKHIPTIEEVLCLSGWSSPSDTRRGGTIEGTSGDVDWFFKANGIPIYLEAKYRPSGWPHLSDRGTYRFLEGTLLKNSAHKFPARLIDAGLHIVSITGPSNLNKDFVHQLGQELQNYSQIHAVVYRSLAQMTHVLSLSESVASQVLQLLTRPSVRDYPANYFIGWHIEQRDQRLSKRALSSAPNTQSPVVCRALQPTLDAKINVLPEGAYRTRIKNRGPDGEPFLEFISRLLWKEGFGPDAKPA